MEKDLKSMFKEAVQEYANCNDDESLAIVLDITREDPKHAGAPLLHALILASKGIDQDQKKVKSIITRITKDKELSVKGHYLWCVACAYFYDVCGVLKGKKQGKKDGWARAKAVPYLEKAIKAEWVPAMVTLGN